MSGSQNTQEGSFASCNGPDSQSANTRASEDDGATNIRVCLEDVGAVEAGVTRANSSTTTQALRQVAEQSLRNNDFESKFRANHIAEDAEEAEDAVEDDTPDEAETLSAPQWSEATQHEIDVVESDGSHDSVNFQIVGVERTFDNSGVKWWYLMRHDDITVYSKNLGHGECDTLYGNATMSIPLQNGYQFVRFSPRRIRCRKVPKHYKVQLWSKIGLKFWSLTTPHGDIRWDGGENRYMDLSNKWSVHLCSAKECEGCRRIYGELAGR